MRHATRVAIFAATLVIGTEAATAQLIAYFPLPTECQGPPSPCILAIRLGGIAAGPGMTLWFTEEDQINGFGPPSAVWIGRITTSGEVTRWPLDLSRSLGGITMGPDGNMWFAERVVGEPTGMLGRITPEGVVTEFSLPSAGFRPLSIVGGPDGRIWFVEANFTGPVGVWRVGAVTPAGQFQEFPLNGVAGGITVSPDGNLWVVQGSALVRLTTSGSITEFPLPTPSATPGGITTGPDMNLWFTQIDPGTIGRMTPAGTVVEYELPPGHTFPGEIVAGSDGALWFTQGEGGAIGRISLTGEITHVPASGESIAAGPDGNIWFTTPASIGRVSPGGGLLLQQARFSVSVTFESGGRGGPAHAVPQTSDTGAFWFFAPTNLELMVKVLDGRAVNGHFWVFYGALSNVEYTITVTDTNSGATRTYTNPAGQLASKADTRAFQ